MQCRGIRGAITAQANERKSIIAATKELLEKMVQANSIETRDIAAIFFTTTTDLNAEFPAAATRELGWTQQLALLCGHEMIVPNSLPRCIRVLMLVNTEKNLDEIAHVYLGGARILLEQKKNLSGGER